MSDPEQKGIVDPARFAADFDHHFRTDEKVPRIDLSGIDQSLHQEIALKLIDQGYGSNLIEDLSQFKGVDQRFLIDKLIEAEVDHTLCANLDLIDPKIDRFKLALDLIERGKAHSVASYLHNFPDDMHQKLKVKMLEMGESKLVEEHKDWFKE